MGKRKTPEGTVNKGGRPPAHPEFALAKPVMVRLPGALYAMLEGEADERGETIAATLRDIVHEYFATRRDV